MAASNTEECLLELRGRTIVGVLMNATHATTSQSTRTLLLDDGTGITWNERGAFWRESANDVKRVLDARIKELEKTQDALSRMPEHAGAVAPAAHADGDGA